MDDETWRDRLLSTRHIALPGERAALYRDAARGRFTAVIRGVYLPSGEWETLGPDARHLMRMRAHEVQRPGTVFSHLSAALAWNLPIVGTRLTVPHTVVDAATGGRSRNGLIRHTLGVPENVRRVDGLHLTSPRDTLLQVAGLVRPETSVPILDAALARSDWSIDRDELRDDARFLPHASGPRRSEWAIGFADARSGSAGESLSRVSIWRARLPYPELQCRFTDAAGLIGIVDFFWPEFGLIGEFDGHGKYLRDELRGGRDVAAVVMDEKRRENRLRAVDLRVARWEWSDALHPARLGSILRAAGLRAL